MYYLFSQETMYHGPMEAQTVAMSKQEKDRCCMGARKSGEIKIRKS